MPNYSPHYSLVLRANAYEALDKSPLVFHYGGFWDTFYEPPKENSLRCMFRALFAGHEITKPIVIVSVFEGMMGLKKIKRDMDAIYVGFSGEPHHLDPRMFDINLIMKPTDIPNKTILLPNFATNAYEMGLWPYLQVPRFQIPVEKKRFCAFVVRNGGAHVRNKFVKELSKYKMVDYAGPFMNNIGYNAPEDEQVYGDRYLGFLQNYKFVMCFENSNLPGYITEKLLNAYLSGAIPIYWGTSEVLSWLNPKAFLYLKDDSQESICELIGKIKDLDTNEDLYQQMHKEPLVKEIPEEWKIETIREHIKKVLINNGI